MRPNSFIRHLPTHLVTPGQILDLKKSGIYFSGCTWNGIYLSDFYTPNTILKIDSGLKDSTRYHFNFSHRSMLLKGAFSIAEDSSIYVLDGNQPAMFSGSVNSNTEMKFSKPPYFTSAISTGKRSFILRVVINRNNVLVKYKADSIGFRSGNTVLKKQVDGLFCTDGNLIKTPDSKRMFYIYHYRNQFLCADSNLNLLYAGKTIDTNAHAKIKVSYIKSSNQTTLSAPPIYVNKQAAANNRYLFVVSGLRADNEQGASLDGFSTIDVYEVQKGKYQFSFYLPNFNNKKLTDFRVDEHSLYALYDHYLYKYQLNF